MTDVSTLTQLPASGDVNTLYRVAGTNTYSEYGWNGTQFVKLDEKEYGIDEEPTAGSDNLVKSGGVAECVYTFLKKTPTSSISGYCISSNGGIKSSGNFRIDVYELSNNNSIKITGTYRGSGYNVYAFYSVSEISSENLVEIGPSAVGSGDKQIDVAIPVPQSALYLAVSVYTPSTNPLSVYEPHQIQAEIPEMKDDIYSINEILTVTGCTNYSTEDVTIVQDTAISNMTRLYLSDNKGYVMSYVSCNDESIKKYTLLKGTAVLGEDLNVGVPYFFDLSGTNVEYIKPIIRSEQALKGGSATFLLSAMDSGTIINNILKYADTKFKKKFILTMYSTGIRVKRDYADVNYDNAYISTYITASGPNSIVQMIQSVYTNKDGSTTYGGGTDWISPYTIEAVHNGNGNSGITGGYHGYDGGQSGSPTGRTDKFIVEVDGNIVTENKDYEGNVIRLTVINYIQAGNTKEEDGSGREVLKQMVTYEFIDDKIYVTVDSIALEEINIINYYGLSIAYYNSRYDFIGKDGIATALGSETQQFSNYKDTECIIGYKSVDDDESYCVELHLDENIDLGSYRLHDITEIMSNGGSAFCIGYGSSGLDKAYYNLIRETPLHLNAGERCVVKGYYRYVQKTDFNI